MNKTNTNMCAYPNCDDEALFSSPADLCLIHWNEWFEDYAFEVYDRKVITETVGTIAANIANDEKGDAQ